MNYVDDGYVIDDLREFVRKNENNRVSIIWIPDRQQPDELTPRILKSIAYWKVRLPDLVKASGSDILPSANLAPKFSSRPTNKLRWRAISLMIEVAPTLVRFTISSTSR